MLCHYNTDYRICQKRLDTIGLTWCLVCGSLIFMPYGSNEGDRSFETVEQARNSAVGYAMRALGWLVGCTTPKREVDNAGDEKAVVWQGKGENGTKKFVRIREDLHDPSGKVVFDVETSQSSPKRSTSKETVHFLAQDSDAEAVAAKKSRRRGNGQ